MALWVRELSAGWGQTQLYAQRVPVGHRMEMSRGSCLQERLLEAENKRRKRKKEVDEAHKSNKLVKQFRGYEKGEITISEGGGATARQGPGTVIRSRPQRTGGAFGEQPVCRVTPDSLLVIWRRGTLGDLARCLL